ncbi:hypothetical protein M514_10730, partial [Trichuris suis]
MGTLSEKGDVRSTLPKPVIVNLRKRSTHTSAAEFADSLNQIKSRTSCLVVKKKGKASRAVLIPMASGNKDSSILKLLI